LVARSIRAFENHPERRELAEREAAWRADLAAVEAELADLSVDAGRDDLDLLDAGQSSFRSNPRLRRTELEERRRLLLRTLSALPRKRGELDARVAREVLAPLAEPYRQLVAQQAEAIRKVAERNDLLTEISAALDRSGLIGASHIIYPMNFGAAGSWSDESSSARSYWSEATTAGLLAPA
jgi:acyl-CoA reductase-like NAD-dependent aldehyde dehydrogenase